VSEASLIKLKEEKVTGNGPAWREGEKREKRDVASALRAMGGKEKKKHAGHEKSGGGGKGVRSEHSMTDQGEGEKA